MRHLPWVPCLVLPLAASHLAAQTTLFEHTGSDLSNGSAITGAFVGDVDGDGRDDVLVGVYTDDTAGMNAGVARVFSGADGTLLHELFGTTGDYFGYAADRVGDLNGDGRDEFIVGAPRDAFGIYGSVGTAQVYDGATGAQLYVVGGVISFDWYGGAVCGAGDLNNDGLPDFAVGASGADQSPNDNRGSVRAFSGADGSELFEVFGTTVDHFGRCVNPVGDVDGDGFDDLVCSALDVTEPNAEGQVKVLSGADGSVLHTSAQALPWYWYGVSCDGLGDVDGDGRPDYAIGIKNDPTVGFHSGAVEIRSGATGGVLHTLYADTGADQFGESVAGAGDVDGDGLGDVIVGAGEDHWGLSWQGSAAVFSGATGDLIYRVYGEAYDDAMGRSVAGFGDVNGDGEPDVIAVTPGNDDAGSNSGKLRVLTLASPACVDVTSYCDGLPNSTGLGATLHFSGTTSVSGNDLTLHSSNGPADQPGLFYMGPDQVSVPFGNGLRCVGGSTVRLGVAYVGFFGFSSLVVDNDAPQLGGVIQAGVTLNVQYWYRDPGTGAEFNLSDALAISFCP